MTKEDLNDLIGLTENEARAMAALSGEEWVSVLYQTPRGWQNHAGRRNLRLTLKVNLDDEVVEAFYG